MKILILNYEFPPLGGGAGNATYYIGKELVKAGDSVTVITSRYKEQKPEEIIDGIKIIRLRANRKYLNKSNPVQMSAYILSSSIYLLTHYGKIKPDVILCILGIPSGPPGLLMNILHGVPYAVSLRGGDVPGTQPEQLAFFHKITKPLIKIIWKKAFCVASNSEGLKQLAAETLPGKNIICIPNGIDLEKFPFMQKPISDTTINFLFIGRASQEKNLTEALHALAQCKDYNWKMRVVGDGPELEKWKQESKDFGISDRIDFPGWKDKKEIPAIIAASDIFIFPSTSEGMPNVLLEAMAGGLPAAATSIRGNVDIVEDGKSGFLYQPGDTTALVSILKNYLSDKELIKKMSRQARERAESFSWEKTALAYRDCFLKEISKKK